MILDTNLESAQGVGLLNAHCQLWTSIGEVLKLFDCAGRIEASGFD